MYIASSYFGNRYHSLKNSPRRRRRMILANKSMWHTDTHESKRTRVLSLRQTKKRGKQCLSLTAGGSSHFRVNSSLAWARNALTVTQKEKGHKDTWTYRCTVHRLTTYRALCIAQLDSVWVPSLRWLTQWNHNCTRIVNQLELGWIH